MAQTCPLCGGAVGDEHARCPACGAEMDPYGTMQMPRPKASAAPVAAPPRPAPAPPAPDTRLDEAEREPAPPPPRREKPARPKPRPVPAPAVVAPPRPAPAPPPPPPPPQPAPPPYATAPPPMPAGWPPAPPSPPPQPGVGLRGWLIKQLGGQPEPSPPPAPPAGYPHPSSSGFPPVASGSWNPAGAPPSWNWNPAAAPHPSMAQSVAAYPPAPPVAPGPIMPPMGPGPDPGDDPGDDEAKTQYMPGADLGRLKFPSSIYTLQLLDHNGQWRSYAPIGANGVKLGRSQSSADFPFLSSMATRHVRFVPEGQQVKAEDLGSLNGVYLKITAPVELEDGMRFRVGSQVIEFRRVEPYGPSSPAQGPDGEEFLSFDLSPLAELVLIRPNNEPGLRFPITKPEATKIGRDGRAVDLMLPKAEWVSSQHAQVRHQEGRFLLEDLNSRNGTFIQIRGATAIRAGDILLVGRAFLRVADQAGGG